MPRYRVILEFDHPGEGKKCDDQSLTRSPDKWHWDQKLDSVCSAIAVYVYSLDAQALGTHHYQQGRG